MKDIQATKNILTLLQSDASNLFYRIRDRLDDYIMVFSVKRSRSHFKEIFKNKYELSTFDDLKYCSEEVILECSAFFNKVDEIKWFLNYTEEMPATVEERMRHHIRELESSYEIFMDAINAQRAQMSRDPDVVSVGEPIDESEEMEGEIELPEFAAESEEFVVEQLEEDEFGTYVTSENSPSFDLSDE